MSPADLARELVRLDDEANTLNTVQAWTAYDDFRGAHARTIADALIRAERTIADMAEMRVEVHYRAWPYDTETTIAYKAIEAYRAAIRAAGEPKP